MAAQDRQKVEGRRKKAEEKGLNLLSLRQIPVRLSTKLLCLVIQKCLQYVTLDSLQKSGTGNREQGTEADKTEHLQEVYLKIGSIARSLVSCS